MVYELIDDAGQSKSEEEIQPIFNATSPRRSWTDFTILGKMQLDVIRNFSQPWFDVCFLNSILLSQINLRWYTVESKTCGGGSWANSILGNFYSTPLRKRKRRSRKYYYKPPKFSQILFYFFQILEINNRSSAAANVNIQN